MTPASWVVIAFLAATVIAHLYRDGAAPAGTWAEQYFLVQYALIPVFVGENPQALFTHMFVHGGWLHLAMNAAFYAMLGWVAARRIGDGIGGAVWMTALTIGSGLGGAAMVMAINPASQDAVVGFSGAVCGIAAAYLLSQHVDWRAALADRRVQVSTFWFLALNVGLAWAATQSGVIAISWEAHLGGFAAGGAIWIAAASLRARSDPRQNARGPWA